jgi:acyl carrier protein
VTEQRDLTPARGDDVAEALLEVVRDLVADIRPAHDGRSVRLDSRLDADLGLDSLAVAELLVRLEHRFAITLPEQVLAHAETPRDLLDALADGSASTSERSAAPSARLDWGDRPSGPTLAPGDAATLLDVLDWHVETHPDLVHLRLLAESGRGPVELTYAELRQRAADVAAGLRQRGTPPGTAVAVMLPTSRRTSRRSSGSCSPAASPHRSTRPGAHPGSRTTSGVTSACSTTPARRPSSPSPRPVRWPGC